MNHLLFVDHLETPLGPYAIVVDGDGHLRAAGWTEAHVRMERHLRAGPSADLRPAANPAGLTEVFRAYFAGDLHAVDGVRVLAEGTDFQRAVWSALREIPCGETRSYAEIARRIGQPSAVRAVGLANGANPINIVVPCHRVIGADGSLTGYGGGIRRKRWLLSHEGAHAYQCELPAVQSA